MPFLHDERLSELRQEFPGLSEVVTHPMRDGVLGNDNAQPCDPEDRTHWLIAGITGARDSDWVSLHEARGVPSLPLPENELADLLWRLELPVTIILHTGCIGPCETLSELTGKLREFINSDLREKHPLLAAARHPLTALHAALVLTIIADTRATDPGRTGFL